MTGEARALLLAALAEVGVEPDDYARIELAKMLVDQVNTRLRARGSAVVYSVTFCTRAPEVQMAQLDSAIAGDRAWLVP